MGYPIPLLLALLAPATTVTECDLLFAGGRVVDGTGAPWFRADVCVAGDRIAAVGDLGRTGATRRIDASALVVAPGFIDMLGQSEYNVLVDNRAASKITQGITTEITGEGSSIAPRNARMVADDEGRWKHYGVTPDWTDARRLLQAFERARPAINLGTFVGAGGVRDLVIGKDEPPGHARRAARRWRRRSPRPWRTARSASPPRCIYVPDPFASTEEIIALAKVAARYGGSYITHQRDEGASDGIDESLDEVFRIAREAGIPAEIYHLKTAGQAQLGPDARRPEADRGGARPGARRHRRPVSLDGQLQLPRRVACPLGARGRHARSWSRACGTRHARARRRERDFLRGGPGLARRAAARILVTSVLEPRRCKKYEGKTHRADRAGRGQGPAGRAHGPRHRRPRQHRRSPST